MILNDKIKDAEEESANQGVDHNEEDDSAIQCAKLKKMMMKEEKNANLQKFIEFLIPY